MKNRSYSKMVIILALILITATSLWFVSPATPCYAQGGYAETPVSGGGGGGLPIGYTSLGDTIDHDGVLTHDSTAKSSDINLRYCPAYFLYSVTTLNPD